MNIGESYSIPLDERNLQGMTLHRTSRAPSLSPVPTNSSFPFQPPEATTAEVTGIFILTVLMLFVGAFAICSALCRSTSPSPEPARSSAREPGSSPPMRQYEVSPTSVEMARSLNQTIEAMTLQQKRDYITRLLLAKTFCTPNRDKQTSTLTDREMPDCEDRDILYDPEIAQCTEVCAICLEQFLSGDDVCESRNEMCKHRFHTACALEWLSKSQLCPCCRRNYLCQKAGDRDTQVASVEVEQQLEAEGNSSNPGDQDEPIGSDGWIELLVMLDLNG